MAYYKFTRPVYNNGNCAEWFKYLADVAVTPLIPRETFTGKLITLGCMKTEGLIESVRLGKNSTAVGYILTKKGAELYVENIDKVTGPLDYSTHPQNRMW